MRAASASRSWPKASGTREQLEFLDVRGCDCFQGFWASKPLSADAFYDFVRLKSVGRVVVIAC